MSKAKVRKFVLEIKKRDGKKEIRELCFESSG